VEAYIARTLRELKREKIETLLEKRYDKIRAIGTSPADELKRKTQAARTRIEAALKAIPRSHPGHQPAQV
jgi:hypothetical protein